MQVKWTKRALHSLDSALAYIREDSPQAALHVLNRIIHTLEAASRNPLRWPPDPDKRHNTGIYRVCRVFRYRISYRIASDDIFVVKLRHTSQQRRPY